MRGLLWLIALFALAVGLSLVTDVTTGYALIVVPPYRIQVSFHLLILTVLAVLLAGYFLIRLVSRTVRLPSTFGAYRHRRRKDKVSDALRDAMLLQLEGRYAPALKQARKAWRAGDESGVSALIAARSAHALGDDQRYRQWLGHAAEHDKTLRSARVMTEAEMAIEGHRFDEAAASIDRLKEGSGRPLATLRLALSVAQANGDWDEVIRIARQLHKHGLLGDEQIERIVRQAHLAALRDRDGQPDAIDNYWNAIPADDQRDRELVRQVAPLIVGNGRGALLRRVIEKLLDAHWESDLARWYGYCGEDDPRACLVRAEQWLQSHPNDAGLLFSLGRLCMQNEVWGKAQGYLEASVAKAPMADTYLTLAQLAERMDRPADAQRHYRTAAQLKSATALLPTLPETVEAAATAEAVDAIEVDTVETSAKA